MPSEFTFDDLTCCKQSRRAALVKYNHLIPISYAFWSSSKEFTARLEQLLSIDCIYTGRLQSHLFQFCPLSQMASITGDDQPLFSAVSSSARQLYQLLRCISFAPKAQVQIRKEGLRFTVEESRVMQGHSQSYSRRYSRILNAPQVLHS